jgi:perosamine synthetase
MIPLAKPFIDKNDVKAIKGVLKSERLSIGPKVEQFEKAFARLIGTKYAVAVNSGTSGLHLCIKALGIKQGDEVITTPFSFVSSSNCVLFEGAKPVFVDVDENTFNINPDLIEEKITKKTKAILPVHIFGQSCDMKKIMAIAKKHKLKVIEDACESIGATNKRKKTGTFGDAAVFAFYPNKQMTTGEGGMIVTNDLKVSKLCSSYRNQGRGESMQWLLHERLGYNYRMSELHAALGVSQISKINKMLSKRKKVVNKYLKALKKITQITLPTVKKGNIHAWFVFPIKVPEKYRNKLVNHLLERGIQSKAYFYPPIHLQPFYRKEFGYRKGDFPVTEKLSNSIIILPLYIGMKKKEVLKVKKAIEEFFVKKNLGVKNEKKQL